ncbi:hypothetical protein C2845_PM02G07710 [Panicum miliaceum]|uniref:Uncharacterized protein n=1 Tax=Panicum miliaceum TaxID=4540 RepID=A0A3L6S565_PANMI|nr:hypothetical protein C2845_PM02G07710 [Panicum miliaceum]
MVGSLRGERRKSFIGCEESFITLTLLRYSYQIFSLGNWAKGAADSGVIGRKG